MIDWIITALIIVQLLTLGALQSTTHTFKSTLLKENKRSLSHFKRENRKVGWWKWLCIKEEALNQRPFPHPLVAHRSTLHLP